MTNAEYKVHLDIFTGPLDLLLYLVRRNELEIADLPIAPIAEQFKEYMDVLKFLDLDLIGDFLVMSSTLLEIKSRQVLPQAVEETEEQIIEDPRSDLIRQLLEYKKYKDAALALEEQAAAWQERYPRLSDDRPVAGEEQSQDLIKEVELWDLVSALARVVRRKVIEKEAKIQYDDTPISVYVERLKDRIRVEEKVAFTSCFDDATQRSKIVGIFLAILEILRHHHYRADQPEEFGEIWIMPPLETNSPENSQISSSVDNEPADPEKH
ncbi:MAG: segregation/condensation protein A [Planctomycetota bacterium]|nr:segregation/condensation protein A [Planctomycetota bacterium]MDA1214734.1 segregation/condensation protein A [Planctomycetota bacterium]